MAEPTGDARSAPSATVARQGSIGMGVAIASLIAFLILTVGAFWAINGDAMTAASARPAIGPETQTTHPRKPQPGPGQIGNFTRRTEPK